MNKDILIGGKSDCMQSVTQFKKMLLTHQIERRRSFFINSLAESFWKKVKHSFYWFNNFIPDACK